MDDVGKQASIAMGWALEEPVTGPMGCGQACARESTGSVHGRAETSIDWWKQAFYTKGWPVACYIKKNASAAVAIGWPGGAADATKC